MSTRDSFVIYRTFYKSIKHLSPKKKCLIINAVFDYALDGVMPQGLEPSLMAVFEYFKEGNDRAAKRYEIAVESGRKGGLARASKANLTVTDTDTVTVKGNESERVTAPSPKKFINPTFDFVKIIKKNMAKNVELGLSYEKSMIDLE